MHSSGGTWKLIFCLSSLPEDLGSVLLVTSICKECVVVVHFCLVILILSFSLFYFVLALSTGQLFTILVLLIISYDISAYWQMLENSNYDCSCLKLHTSNNLSVWIIFLIIYIAVRFKRCTVAESSVSGCTCLLHAGLVILPYPSIISAKTVSVWAEDTSWNLVIEIIYVVVSSLPWWRSFCYAKLKCPGSGFRCVGLIYWKTRIRKVVRQCRFTM